MVKFFDPNVTLKLLELDYSNRDVADFGCGYGTFTIPAAQIISGKIYALDIEPEVIRTVEQKARAFWSKIQVHEYNVYNISHQTHA